MKHYVYQIVDDLTHQFYFGVRTTELNPIDMETGIHLDNISSTCIGIRKSAGGYIWKFKKGNG